MAKSSRVKVDTEVVDIADLEPFPGNPRRGDVDAIAESLKVNGQYRPIVVNRRTMQVLAGNHTLRAARKLKWKRIAVSFVDVDEVHARRIVLADNRTHDRGSYDSEALVELLNSVSTLDGTGYTPFDIDRLELEMLGDDLFADAERPPREPGPTVAVEVGVYRIHVERDEFTPWEEAFMARVDGDRNEARKLLVTQLGMDTDDVPPPVAGRRRRTAIDEAEMHLSLTEVRTEPVDSLVPFPANAREGDVGAIAESLAANGQYRPIVVNRKDRHILVGNHTWLAAKALGWDTISVSWVDVDDDQAARIVLADNRTAEMGYYDETELASLLRGLAEEASLDGTGFDGDDLDDLLRALGESVPRKQTAAGANVPLAAGNLRTKVVKRAYLDWEAGVQEGYGYAYRDVGAAIIDRLRLPEDACTVSKRPPPQGRPRTGAPDA